MKIFQWFEDWRDAIIQGITAPFVAFSNALSGKLREAAIGILEDNERAMKAVTDAYLDEIMKNNVMPDAYKKIITDIKASKHQSDYPIQLAMIIGGLVGAITAASTPSSVAMQRKAFRSFPSQGLNAQESIIAFWRGLISEAQYDDEMRSNGYPKEYRSVLEGISKYYPSAQDFITFAVRDTFNPDVVKKYRYDENYPSQIDAYVAKAGIDPEWMKHYWRAHWQLPSPTQMYEMIHRNKITMADAETLLKIADYSPYFIKPMLEISYNPYTRVDIRRMWDTGVLSREEVKRGYLDGGYDDEHAEKLTAWTVAEGMKEEADLTKAEIKAAYVAGELTASDAMGMFKNLGYDDRESEIIIALADWSTEKALRTREKNILVKQYAKNKITLTMLETGLDALKMSEREKKITVAEAKLQAKEEAV